MPTEARETPAAEVVERLRKAADNIERARMSGIVENLAGWEQRAVRDAAECIAHLNAERLSRESDKGVPEGFWLAPNELDDAMIEACAGAFFAAFDKRVSGSRPFHRWYEAIRAAAPQPPTVSTQGWHPIETGIAELADDTLVIVGCTQGFLDIWCGRYLREEKDKQDRGVYRSAPHLDWFPTHWMPRPAAPASVSDKTEAV